MKISPRFRLTYMKMSCLENGEDPDINRFQLNDLDL